MKFFRLLLIAILLPMLFACRATKHVGDGEYLLDKVSLSTDNKSLKNSELKSYIRQEPNHKTFGIIGLPLFFYNLSGKKDNGWNRWLRRIGTPPVIYDSELTERSRSQIEKALNNKGYADAVVTVDTIKSKKRIKVKYSVQSGEPYHIDRLSYRIQNDSIRDIVMKDTSAFLIRNGKLFDRNVLEEERQRIAAQLREKGYYAFTKDYISYVADTTIGNKGVDLELNLSDIPVTENQKIVSFRQHDTYTIRNVYFVTDYNPLDRESAAIPKDTVLYKGFYVLYGDKKYLRPSTLIENCYIVPGQLYSTRMVDNTYSAFSRLKVLKYVNITFRPVGDENNRELDCHIMITEGKTQLVSTELEGTNSAGNFGFSLGLTYQHRNIFKGSQTFSAKFRAAYENITGDLGGLLSNNYLELSGEFGVSFPKFLFPFTKSSFLRRMRATTEFTMSMDYQQRPEYVRLISGVGWNYKWYSGNNRFRHHFDLVDISYVYLPQMTAAFKNNLDSLAADNPLLRYSYEDHFIMRSSYVMYMTNLRSTSTQAKHKQRTFYTLRAAGEIAGNLLYAISSISKMQRSSAGEYEILGIGYSQYAKADIDYTRILNLNEKNALAFHVGAGIIYPYGNSDMVPFEKRYYSGGANSVRGWSVRTLGPGTYSGTNPLADFMNQCGDIRLDLNAEYRSKLIWKLELALFLDAGNIWTIKDYSSQQGGQFKFNSFYKEIALAYGLGVRLDFNYFLLRVDMGMKMYDPSRIGNRPWVIAHHTFSRDASFHFAVGYPF
ncbi:MAG: BamA/TamA family outer membrane protein [Coprobacter sp.]|nr:BamA/TamA family outer membrane protein [Coprobacter sp.]